MTIIPHSITGAMNLPIYRLTNGGVGVTIRLNQSNHTKDRIQFVGTSHYIHRSFHEYLNFMEISGRHRLLQ